MDRLTRRALAAQLVADDRLSNERIAAEVGVTRKTIDNWKTEPAFAAQVQEIVQAARVAAMAYGIAVKEERIRGYQERERLYWQLLSERARRGQELQDDPGLTPGGLPLPTGKEVVAPGVETGLLVRQERMTALGTTIVTWAVDTGLLAEMRALEKQAAQEMEQWTERTEVVEPDGTANPRDYLTRRIDELAARRRAKERPGGTDGEASG